LVYAQNYVNFKQPVSGMISDEVWLILIRFQCNPVTWYLSGW
jgi:hypothetical protein